MDMTKGTPWKNITRFSIPLIFGNIMQQFYTLADAMIVGKVLGYKALAALGSADWLAWFMTSIINGITMGYCTKAAQEKGRQSKDGLFSVSAMCIFLSILLSILLFAVGQVVAMPALQLLDTPSDIITDAYHYLRIIYLGIPLNLFYNTFSALLRADGDSKTPFGAMVVSSITNIVLDALFVLVCGWGVISAAIATVLAQGVSTYICLMRILRNENLRFTKDYLTPNGSVLASILRYSLPMTFQFCVVATSGLFIQYLTNRQGSTFIAGYTAANKYYGMMEMGAIALAAALLTYTGQNYGAGNAKRIKQGISASLCVSAVISGFVTLLVILFHKPLLSLFISADPGTYEEIFHYATQFLFFLGCPLYILYLHHTFRSILQGMGDVMTPIFSGLMQFAFRVSSAFIITYLVGPVGIFAAEPFAWTGSVIYLSLRLIYRIRHNQITS